MILPKLPVNYHVLGSWFNHTIHFPNGTWGEVITQELVNKIGIYKEPVEFLAYEFLEREPDLDKLIDSIMNIDLGVDKLKAKMLKEIYP